MKIAITAKGKTVHDETDPRFGRAAYILIIDTESMAVEAIDNSANINAFKGAGIQAASGIHQKGVEVLLTGYCGPNAFRTLEAAGIKVISDISGIVVDVVASFKKGLLEYSESANAEGHW